MLNSLNDKQKATHRGVCLEHLLWYEREGDKFLDHIFKGYKTQCLHCYPETKCTCQQWKHPSSPRLKKSHAIPSTGKVVLTLLVNRCGPLFTHGITDNADCYSKTRKDLRTAVKAQRPAGYHMESFFSMTMPDHSWEAATVLVGSFSASPPQSILGALWLSCVRPNVKGTQRSALRNRYSCTEVITSWLHPQPQDFGRHGINRLVKLWDAFLNNHGAYCKNLVIMLCSAHSPRIYQTTLIYTDTVSIWTQFIYGHSLYNEHSVFVHAVYVWTQYMYAVPSHHSLMMRQRTCEMCWCLLISEGDFTSFSDHESC